MALMFHHSHSAYQTILSFLDSRETSARLSQHWTFLEMISFCSKKGLLNFEIDSIVQYIFRLPNTIRRIADFYIYSLLSYILACALCIYTD